ncbi:MAG: mechanosensitive ion channel family protein [Alicyclobacillus macrosporangiidus]|uniref:mechanosensitive ion channel family protein n=1 Tax=Alicyclobacillus macrosporangiidus TaxID=392015 RepID=UPI0026EC95B9|nr:mechanosensitive ion channel family protein [Alicyclobacillus macrosporangiidus]MCL6598783.1 mechanosensitive ion channel family protein [Alicyclobacillus macrosporangiidus]
MIHTLESAARDLFLSGAARTVAGRIIGIVGFFILTRIAIRIGVRTVHRLLSSPAVKMDERRRGTLASLMDNVVRYTLYFIYFLIFLELCNFHVQTLLAGAGLAGLVVGLGAQSLIKDVLTGLFILFEDQYGVGDYVKINNFTGTVDSIGLRVTRIRAWTGEIEIIPNGQIQQVTNYSRYNSLAVVDVGVRSDADLQRAMAVMGTVMREVASESDDVVGPVQVLGVQAITQAEVTLRATAECRPMNQFGVERLCRLRIKEAFDRAGIPLASPQREIWVHNPMPAGSGVGTAARETEGGRPE